MPDSLRWRSAARSRICAAGSFGAAPKSKPSSVAGVSKRARRIRRAREVLSPVAQRKGGFRVEHLPASTHSPHEQLYATPRGQALLDAFEERLRDNTLTPVPDQVGAIR